MTRVINCEDCNTYLGEIRDATLKKNTKHYCWPCSEKKQVKSDFVDDLIKSRQPDTRFMDGFFKGDKK